MWQEKNAIYRGEVLSALCSHDIKISPKPAVSEDIDIMPLEIIEANLEGRLSLI